MTHADGNSGDSGPLTIAAKRLRGTRRTIKSVEAILLRAPIAGPVRTSFGVMHDRPGLMVRITDTGGCTGHGEIWCNFPAAGAEYKAALLTGEFAAWLRGREFTSPAGIFDGLNSAFAVLALQTGDAGVLNQIIAGIDQALWDLVAREQNMRLCEFFGAAGASVPAYASGIHPDHAHAHVEAALATGFTAFKVKTGFGRETDMRGVAAAHGIIGENHSLMIDANQAWASPEEAAEHINALAQFPLRWAEEAMPADTETAAWNTLAGLTAVPLAGGENLPSLGDIAAYRKKGIFAFLQPDIGKIGGFTGLLRILADADGFCVYCPHWLGGKPGLAASAHLLAVIGGDGLLEVDVNENPIRDYPCPWDKNPGKDGRIALPEDAGIGVVPDLRAMGEAGVKVKIMGGG